MYLDGKIIVDDKEYNLIHGYYTYEDKDVENKYLEPFLSNRSSKFLKYGT